MCAYVWAKVRALLEITNNIQNIKKNGNMLPDTSNSTNNRYYFR